jgi:hypothetical protein
MFASSPGVIGPFMRLLLMGLAIWGSLGTPAEVFAAMASRNDGAHHASPSLLATSASLTVISRSILAAEGGVDDLARVTFDRGRRLDPSRTLAHR